MKTEVTANEKISCDNNQKNVPQNVRDFIDMMSAKKPARKPRNFLPAETEKQSEQ